MQFKLGRCVEGRCAAQCSVLQLRKRVRACKPVASAILRNETDPLHAPMRSSVSIFRLRVFRGACCPVCVDVVVSALFVCTVHSLTMLLFCTRNCSQEFSLKLWAPELQRNCQTPARSRIRCRGWVLIRCYHYLWAFVHFCLSFDTRAVSAFFLDSLLS